MSSRILSPDAAAAVQPMSWGRSGSPPPLAPTPWQGTPQPTTAQTVASTGDQSSLQSRIAELERSLDLRVHEARQAGFREGEQAAQAKAGAQVQAVLENLAQSIQQICNLRGKLRHEAESDLLKLSVAIARKILHREISADPEALAGLIRVALEKLRVQEIVRVRVHPQQHGTVQEIVNRLSQGVQIETIADPRLPLGGVVVETTRGEFDSSVEVQLREIERGLVDRLAAKS